MKTNQRNAGATFGKACLNGCKKILAQIRNAKEAVLAEARETVKVHEQMLQLAVNEAEALAWQTMYPQLVFPNLAVEKVRGVAAWNSHQRSLAR
jgi:hypothetical protein